MPVRKSTAIHSMTGNLRMICLETGSGLTEEMQGTPIANEAWDHLLFRMKNYGLRLEGLTRETAEALRREAQALGMEVCLAGPSSGRETILLLGNGRQFEEMTARASAIPTLAEIAGGLQGSLHNLLRSDYRLRCGDCTLELGRRTVLMGVLNVTPDSFSDGGRFLSPERAVDHGHRLIEEGADLLDIGGESSRPGAEPLSAEEELGRILTPLRFLAKAGIPISVDTCKAEVARVALKEGASLINDISGLRFDPSLAEVVARAGAGLVLMHMKGTPKTMQKSPHYHCLMGEVFDYLQEGIALAESAGVRPEGILIDPGLGFGKNLDHNLTLLRRLREFKCLGKPILIGPSRKSFIGKVLDLPLEEHLEGTAAVVAWAIWQGASIVRVHDVKEMKRIAGMIDVLRDGGA